MRAYRPTILAMAVPQLPEPMMATFSFAPPRNASSRLPLSAPLAVPTASRSAPTNDPRVVATIVAQIAIMGSLLKRQL
jgi:hypothetical protein